MLGRRTGRTVRAADARRVPDGVLHVPRRVPGVLRRWSGSGRSGTPVAHAHAARRPASGHDRTHAARSAGDDGCCRCGSWRCCRWRSASTSRSQHCREPEFASPAWLMPAAVGVAVAGIAAGVAHLSAPRDRRRVARRRCSGRFAARRSRNSGSTTSSRASSPPSLLGVLAPRRLGRPLPRGRRAERRQRVDGDGRRRPANDSDRAARRTTSTASPSASSFCSSGCGGQLDVNGLPILSDHDLGAVRARRSPSCSSRASGRCSCAGRRWPARRVSLVASLWVYWAYDRAAAGFQFQEELALVPSLGISYLLAIDGMSALMCAADVDHHLRRRLRVVDGQGAQPGVLRAAAASWSPASTACSSRSTCSSSSCSTRSPCCRCICSSASGDRRARCGRRASSAGRWAEPASAPRNTRR